MKKSMILLGMLSIGYANAQEGTVGINTENPKATLDVTPEANNLTGTTNEGIIAPRLSKTRIANIEASKLTEGTLIYATDEATSPISAYTGADAKVAKITEKGYYFYNGTEWVKAGVGANGELWAQRDNNGVTETYLKPADTNSDFIGYKNGGKWALNIGNVNESDFDWSPTTKGFSSLEIPVSLAISSDRLPLQSTIGGGKYFYFSNNSYLLKNAHTSQNSNGSYVGNEQRLVLKDTEGTNINSIVASVASLDIHSNSSINSVVGVHGLTSVGTDVYNQVIATNNTAGKFTVRNYGTSTNMYGGEFRVQNRGIAKNIRGVFVATGSHDTDNTSHTIETIKGIDNYVSLKSNGTLKSSLYGQTNTVDIRGNATIEEGALVRGLASSIYLDRPTTGVKNIINYVSSFYPKDVSIDLYEDFTAYPNLGENTNLKEYIGFRFAAGNINKTASVQNMYGLKIADVTKGMVSNYAIHTGAGKVRVGDLADTGATADRVVTVDANGVLKTGSAANIPAVQVGSTTSMTCDDANRGKMNFVKDVDLGGGKTADAFAVCLKGSDGKHYWRYLYGSAGMHNGTETFGTGLQ